MRVLVPNLKRRASVPDGQSSCCECCDGIEVSTPTQIFNRHGLSAVNYRAATHGTIRASLRAALSSSDFPKLAELLTRDDDDFTIGLIDAFACAGDVLSFYQERLANESWLRTATERLSLEEMSRLVGYRLRPGVAAETWLAFALETPPVRPEGLAPEPGSFITGLPESITLAKGLKVQSVPGPDEKPQTFELVEELAEAQPGWNAMQPWQSEAHVPQRGDREVWLEGVATGLKSGDAVLLVGDEYFANATVENWDFRLLTEVVPDQTTKRTRIAWARGLGSHLPSSVPSKFPYVFALRKRSAIFGNNAPVWRSMNTSFREDYRQLFGGTLNQSEWPQFTISDLGTTASGGHVDLDQVQSELAADVVGDLAKRSLAVLAKGGFNRPDENHPPGTYVELYRVVSTTEVSRAEFALSGKVTRLELEGENYSIFQSSVRETSVYARSEYLPLAERPVTTPVIGARIPVRADASQMDPGRKLVLHGKLLKDGTAFTTQATLVAVHAIGNDRHELEITPTITQDLRRDSLVVHGNVAAASHGETFTQILGNGEAGQTHQRFELKQLPLTYRAAANELGAAAELTIRVNNVAWRERDTLYGVDAAERAHTLTTDEQQKLFAVFGDGKAGARLPSGTNNIRATYRKGLGTGGNVRSDALTQLMSRPLGLKSVSNPLAAEGGTDPEQAEAARNTIPLTTRTLGRAVSILDYEDFARAYSGIAKAQARVLTLQGRRTIAITLAAPDGEAISAASPVWQNLLAALKQGGDPHVPVTLLGYQPSTFRLGISVKCDPDIEQKKVLTDVEVALRAHFAFGSRALGQPVQQSDLIATAQAVAGVLAIDLSRLYGGSTPVSQTTSGSLQDRLLAAQMRVENGTPQPAELLTLDTAPFDALEAMP
jgi:Baseplate J-like protein